MNLINLFKRVLQPAVDKITDAEKPQAEALVLSLGTKLQTAIRSAVSKHNDPATTDAIMAEVEVELTAIEAEVDADIEAFHVKL